METKKEEKDLKIEEKIELENIDYKGDKIIDKIDNIKGPKIGGGIELFRFTNKIIKFYSICFGPNVFVSINGIDFIDRPNIKLPGFNINGPKIDIGIHKPRLSEINIKVPKIDIGIHKPRLSENNIKVPKINAPDFDIKPSLNINGPKIEDNNIIRGNGLPGVDIKGPKIDDGIGLPEVGIKQPINYIIIHGPNIFVRGSEVNLKKLTKINQGKNLNLRTVIFRTIKNFYYNIWKKITKQIREEELKKKEEYYLVKY